MLECIGMKRKANWQDYDAKVAHLEIRMGELQRECRRRGIPIVILYEGFSAAGKGTMISKMIKPLDPRGFKVYTMQKETEEEQMHPYLWRYATKMPAKGRIHVFDRSWYQGYPKNLQAEEIRQYEKQFADDGVVLIKFFLAITKKEQKKRLEHLEKDKNTRWRVTKEDWKKNESYDKYLERYDEMLLNTDSADAPLIIVEAMDKKYAQIKIMACVVERLEQAIRDDSVPKKEVKDSDLTAATMDDDLRSGVLKAVDLSLTIDPEEYKVKRKDLQKRLETLHNKMYLKRVPVILAFEGWDAAGKGGVIKRITSSIDPRGYEVVPTASPNDVEKSHQ